MKSIGYKLAPALFTLMLWMLLGTQVVLAAPQTQEPQPPTVAGGVEESRRYFHHNSAGTIVAITDEDAAVIWESDADEFGFVQGDHTGTNYFLNQPVDLEIGDEGGLFHLGTRLYDPVAGRFMSIDTLAINNVATSAPQGFNRYAYALNNPLRYSDPSGQMAVTGAFPSVSDFRRIIKLLNSPQTGVEARALMNVLYRQHGWKGVAELLQMTGRYGANLENTAAVTQRLTSLVKQISQVEVAAGRQAINLEQLLIKEAQTLEKVIAKHAGRNPTRILKNPLLKGAPKNAGFATVGSMATIGIVLLQGLAIADGAQMLNDGDYAGAVQGFANATPIGLIFWINDSAGISQSLGLGDAKEMIEHATTFWGDLAYEWLNGE